MSLKLLFCFFRWPCVSLPRLSWSEGKVENYFPLAVRNIRRRFAEASKNLLHPDTHHQYIKYSIVKSLFEIELLKSSIMIHFTSATLKNHLSKSNCITTRASTSLFIQTLYEYIFSKANILHILRFFMLSHRERQNILGIFYVC